MGFVRIFLTALTLAAATVTTVLSLTVLPYYNDKSGQLEPLVIYTGILWALFALAVVLLRKVPARAAVTLVIVGAVALGGAAMAGPPNTSTDSARYAWDGIVQNAGISPYDYAPADPAVRHLRTEWLFPTPSVDASGEQYCAGDRVMQFHELDTKAFACTTINRVKVPTIYPPTSEIFFAAERLIVGSGATFWPMQLFGLLMSLGITALLLVALRRRGLNPRWAALWAWSPLAATEGVTNSHIDILGALLLLVASLLVSTGRRGWGGVALGAAIAAKLMPVIGAPALLGRKPWKIILVSIATFGVLYVPYVIASGIGVLGFLPGYLGEEGYETGSRFILLSWFLPGISSTIVAALLIIAIGVITWVRSTPSNPWLGQVMMIGSILLIVSPRYSWYALLLVPMIAMSGRWEWLAVPFALTVRLLVGSIPLGRAVMLAAILLIVVVTIQRLNTDERTALKEQVRHPIRAFKTRRRLSTPGGF